MEITDNKKGVGLIELIFYAAILSLLAMVLVNTLLGSQISFGKTRMRRLAYVQGSAALERMVREIRLAKSIDPTASSMEVNPGALTLNTVVGPTDSTSITRKFFVQNETLMLQEGAGQALPLTSGVKVTNLVFRNAGSTQPSTRYYYVRRTYSGCSDVNNDGLTPATAFCTISKAATLATAGSAVIVGAGTYTETVVLTNSGTETNPIYYVADVSGVYTGDAGEVVVDGGTYGFQFTSVGDKTGIDYTTIDGFKITGSTYGIWAAHGSDFNVIRNNILTGNTDGITLTSTWGNGGFFHSTGWLVEYNDIFNNTNGINFWGGEYTNTVVQYNRIYNNGVGIITSDKGNISWEPANNVLVRHNRIYGNTGDGIQSHFWFDGIFFNNQVYSNRGDGFHVPHRQDTVPQIIEARNNTIRDNNGDGMLFGNESNRRGIDEASILENNIVTQNGESGIDTTLSTSCAVIRNNDVWGNIAASYTGCADQTGTNGNISQDPLYTGPGFDSHLQAVVTGHPANSPAIDVGYRQALNVGLATTSTRTDSVSDAGVADLGFHYTSTSPGVQLFFAGNPVSQAIRIELTVKSGAGKLQSSEVLYDSAVLRGSYQ